MRATLPILAGTLLLAACADTTDPVFTPDYAANPVLEQASGSGHIRQDNNRRTFSFHAQKHADGSASGSFNLITASGVHVTGNVSCLRVVGNEAWIGGEAKSGVAEGTRVAFRVQDGGEGAGSADRISGVFSNRGCAGAARLGMFTVDAGNVQVKGEAVQVTGVYAHDFETPAGSEWSNTKRSTSPSGQSFLGDFSSFQPHGVTLTLNNLPPHSQIRLSFDFYAIRTLDGNLTQYGLDLFTIGESTSGFSFPTTFSGFGGSQSFPGEYPAANFGTQHAMGINTLGYVWNGPTGSAARDASYPVELTLEHSGGSAVFTFMSAALQAFVSNGVFTDESWGIDNVRVSVIR